MTEGRPSGRAFFFLCRNTSRYRQKNHVIVSAELSDRWEIGGAVEQDWSHTSRDLSAAVNVAYRF